jgi:hypothetical protein
MGVGFEGAERIEVAGSKSKSTAPASKMGGRYEGQSDSAGETPALRNSKAGLKLAAATAEQDSKSAVWFIRN